MNTPDENRDTKLTAFSRAFRLYARYKTQTPEYKTLAAQLGYTVPDLNARMSSETYIRMRLRK